MARSATNAVLARGGQGAGAVGHALGGGGN